MRFPVESGRNGRGKKRELFLEDGIAPLNGPLENLSTRWLQKKERILLYLQMPWRWS